MYISYLSFWIKSILKILETWSQNTGVHFFPLFTCPNPISFSSANVHLSFFLINAPSMHKYSLENEHTSIWLQRQMAFSSYLSCLFLLASSGKGLTLWWPSSWVNSKIFNYIYRCLHVRMHTHAHTHTQTLWATLPHNPVREDIGFAYQKWNCLKNYKIFVK